MTSWSITAPVTDAGVPDVATIKTPPALFKTYFDDPTLSDITVELSDRSVHLHRIVLCRGSEYFANLIAGLSQETESNELEFHDDDPEAMMAVLRHVHGLPYASNLAEPVEGTPLLPHAVVYTTAEKYQIHGLKVESCSTMSDIFLMNCKSTKHGLEWLCSSDQLLALRQIITGTPTDDTAGRDLLIMHCVNFMPGLNMNKAFMQLVADVPGLGTDLIASIYNGKDHETDADYLSAKDETEVEDSEDEGSEEEGSEEEGSDEEGSEEEESDE